MLQLGQPRCDTVMASMVFPSISAAFSKTPSLKFLVGRVVAFWHHSTVAMVPWRFQNL